MKIIRGNTLPDYSLLSTYVNKSALDGYQHHERWQHKPVMGVCVEEISGEEIYEIPTQAVENIQQRLNGVRLISSKYNIRKGFDDGKTVLMNTLTEAVVVFDEQEYRLFSDVGCDTQYSYFQIQLFLLGILVRDDVDESFIMEIIRNRSAFTSSDAINIFIYPTQECNANCHYCYQRDEKRTKMTMETADEVVRYITRNITLEDEIVLRWFGGEPLVAHEFIDYISEQLAKHFDNKLRFSSIITTNGYEFTGDLILRAKEKWKARKFHIPIDGYRDEHNSRKGFTNKGIDAYQKLLKDIKKIIDSGIFVMCRLNFDKKNLHQFPSILNDLQPFRDSNMLHIYPTTIRRLFEQSIDDFILPSDYEWYYDFVYRKMFAYGFFNNIHQVLPLRRRGNCMAGLMNAIIINAEGNLFKCLQYSTDERYKVGDCKSGVVFNQNYLNWLDVSIREPDCRQCSYLPLCNGGCKSYRSLNMTEISPCVREKDLINTVFNLVHEWVVTDGKILDNDCSS